MSIPREPSSAFLFLGILYSDAGAYKSALVELEKVFGPLSFLTGPRVFTETGYYNAEMGTPIYRVYGVFERPVNQDKLADIKLKTNEIEAGLAQNGRRRVNLDPGLLSEERLVLATGKNYTHRVYLSRGIYADLTLIFRRGQYEPLQWTYPDYRDPVLRHFLGVLRQKLHYLKTGRLPVNPYRLPSEEQKKED
ncbi:DUF4416 family protein [Thermodesulforhabdus norvegica]|uniref:DUF4416 family protein n=1 Tax=Thermodesulforhabdus norvegica TaxID=39841 RepID=A0A1I4SCS3_9BACT|nr:DUF4416 family protein [Thermodesulforhabdus norvegica]SFM62124.1 protein of unknown function [Thermodesulforhabdus norvegica]